jgi:hypothetical protein
MLLTRLQKREIVRLARQAWLRSPERIPLLESNKGLTKTAVEAAWRHVEQGKVMPGRQSLTQAIQRDYQPLRAHFLRLCGMEAAADAAVVRAATDGRRRALYLLRQALTERELPEAYAAAICRRQFRCELPEAAEKQIWNIIFTVRNRRPATK